MLKPDPHLIISAQAAAHEHRVAPGAARGTRILGGILDFKSRSLIPASLKRNSYVYKKKRKTNERRLGGSAAASFEPPWSRLRRGATVLGKGDAEGEEGQGNSELGVVYFIFFFFFFFFFFLSPVRQDRSRSRIRAHTNARDRKGGGWRVNDRTMSPVWCTRMLYDDSICTPRSVALSMHLRGPMRTLREPTGAYTGQARISPSTARTEIPARSARPPIEERSGEIGIYISS